MRDLAPAQQAIKAYPDSIRQMGILCSLRAVDADPAAQKEGDRRIVTAVFPHPGRGEAKSGGASSIGGASPADLWLQVQLAASGARSRCK